MTWSMVSFVCVCVCDYSKTQNKTNNFKNVPFKNYVVEQQHIIRYLQKVTML